MLRFCSRVDGGAADGGAHDPGERCVDESARIVCSGQQKVGRTGDLFECFLPELNVFVP